MDDKTALDITGLSFHYASGKPQDGNYIIKDFSAGFVSGQAVAILGSNGSGKSTLLNLLIRQLKPVSGSISVFSHDISAMNRNKLARFISFVPQEHHPSFPFTSREIILMGRAPYNGFFGGGCKSDGEELLKIANRLEIGEYLERRYTELSGGERKRVLLARALMQETPVIILDEPESHLDIRHQQIFFSLIKDLCAKENKLCLFSVHNPDLALRYSTHSLLMKKGDEKIIYGPSEQILTCENLKKIYGLNFNAALGAHSEKLIYAAGTPESYIDKYIPELDERRAAKIIHKHL